MLRDWPRPSCSLLAGIFAPLILHPTQVLYSDHSDMLAMHCP